MGYSQQWSTTVVVCYRRPPLAEPIVQHQTDITRERDSPLSLLLVLEWSLGLGPMPKPE